MALRSLMNLLPPKKKLTHARCFIPNMLPEAIYTNVHGYVTNGTDVFIICLSVFHQISDICISDMEPKQTMTH